MQKQVPIAILLLALSVLGILLYPRREIKLNVLSPLQQLAPTTKRISPEPMLPKVNMEQQSYTEYSQQLFNACKTKSDNSCCSSSESAMSLGKYKLVPTEGCRSGYKLNSLHCVDSYQWCEPEGNLFFGTTTKTVIFKNVFYGIKFNYPVMWTYNEENRGTSENLTQGAKATFGEVFYQARFFEKVPLDLTWGGDLFQLRVLSNPESLTIVQWREKLLLAEYKDCEKDDDFPGVCLYPDEVYKLVTETKSVLLDGIPSLRFGVRGFDQQSECVQATKGKYVYEICYEISDQNDSFFKIHRDMTLDVLASVRFLTN